MTAGHERLRAREAEQGRVCVNTQIPVLLGMTDREFLIARNHDLSFPLGQSPPPTVRNTLGNTINPLIAPPSVNPFPASDIFPVISAFL